MNASRQQLERVLDQQYATLTQFIIKLSNACKGIDLVLDNKLAKLRTRLNNNEAIESLDEAFNEIEQHMQKHTAIADQNMEQLFNVLQTSGKQLQQQKGLPAELRRNLRSLMENVNEGARSVLNYVPVFTALVDIYLQVWDAKKDDLGLHSEENESGLDHKATTGELLNLISQLIITPQDEDELKEVQSTLTEEPDTEGILNCCVRVIRMVVNSLSEERSSSQSFLYSLNDTLVMVHQAVAYSLESSRQIHEENDELNERLQAQLDQVSAQVEDADSLNGLKAQIKERLLQIGETLKAKEALERKEQETLHKSLTLMERRLSELETEAENYRQRLAEHKFKSLQDSLTQLPNRAAFDERYDLEVKRQRRTHKPLSLIVIDIDHFKKINDSFGHSVGDRALQIVAKMLKKAIRETDFVARYGGEEFVMLFPGAGVAQLTKLLEQLREKISQIPFKFKDKKITVTISIGATDVKVSDQGRDAFDRADAALYQAKNQGRNRVILG